MKWWFLPVALCPIVAVSGCGSTSGALGVARPVVPATAPSPLDAIDWSRVALSSDFKPMKSQPPATAPAIVFPVGAVAVGFHEEGSAAVAVSSAQPQPQQRVAARLVTKR